ncbi:MAG: zinc-binding dehydrogenase [Candidatus Latescibacterota bacterium]|nr:zinc-binding dehydrogenase [Candidatus Latescibacterota bacterium]
MERVAKGIGKGNILIEEVDTPVPSPTQVLIQAEFSLISRGSELWRRYTVAEAVDSRIMGYSLAGRIVKVGDEVDTFTPGDRVVALAPHAQFVTMEVVNPLHDPSVIKIPESVTAEAATFWPLLTSSVLWIKQTQADENEVVVIIGQGLVGLLCMQVAKATGAGKVIVCDVLNMRCQLASQLGADLVINSKVDDFVACVNNFTTGQGADIVIEAVGGSAAEGAFSQAQDVVRKGGLLQVLGLYGDKPLPLDSGKIQGVRLVGGYLDSTLRPTAARHALQLLVDRDVEVQSMISHKFLYAKAKEAFDLLYSHPNQAMGVLLEWKT